MRCGCSRLELLGGMPQVDPLVEIEQFAGAACELGGVDVLFGEDHSVGGGGGALSQELRCAHEIETLLPSDEDVR